MNTGDTHIMHSLGLPENGLVSFRVENAIDLNWGKYMHFGQDASYILRNRALRHDLCNFELPHITINTPKLESTEEELFRKYRERAQLDFLEEVSADQEFWKSEQIIPQKDDQSWHWDCPCFVQ